MVSDAFDFAAFLGTWHALSRILWKGHMTETSRTHWSVHFHPSWQGAC